MTTWKLLSIGSFNPHQKVYILNVFNVRIKKYTLLETPFITGQMLIYKKIDTQNFEINTNSFAQSSRVACIAREKK